MWPFSKKEQPSEQPPAAEVAGAETTPVEAIESLPEVQVHNSDDFGPFDGDNVAIEDFDFSDFATGVLDMGSLKVPMPQPSEVQVEMGDEGPRMLHIVTQYGRITPVAFASARTGGVWAESVSEIESGMAADGLEVATESGPWGTEVVGRAQNAVIRIIGVDGPRWTLRMTLAAPAEHAENMAALGREVVARTFVYRGETPMVSGSVLPVTMPAELVAQVQEAMAQRQEQAEQQGNESAAPHQHNDVPHPETPTQSQQDAPQGDNGSALEQMRRNGEV